MYTFIDKLNPTIRYLGRLTHNKHYRFIDVALCRLRNPFQSFFGAGWGDVELIGELDSHFSQMIDDSYRCAMPPPLEMHFTAPEVREDDGVFVQHADFATTSFFGEYLPRESSIGYIRIVRPLAWKNESKMKPMVLLLPGTGEKRFGRRYSAVSVPLSRMGIGSIILEGPFYGQRKPKGQSGCKLKHVSDLPLLGAATIEEARCLLRYMVEKGYGPIAVAGVSMGGLHSAMTASLSPFPVGVASLVGPPSAVPVFTEGLMSRMIPWKRLRRDAEFYDLPRLFDQRTHEKKSLEVTKDLMTHFLQITNIENFPPPKVPEATLFAIGRNDRYIPFETVGNRMEKLTELWKGSHVQFLEGSHVSTFLFERSLFCNMIKESLDRVAPLYASTQLSSASSVLLS